MDLDLFSSLGNAITMMTVQIGSRFVQFDFTDAQKKLLQHPVAQSLILLFMFYSGTRNFMLSVLMVVAYYAIVFVLLNEKHPLNIYSREWLVKEGFMKEDSVSALKELYYDNIKKLH
jgi:hypothetical protein